MDRRLIRSIERLVAPLKRRVAMMVGRAIVAAIDDGAGLQRCKITLLRDETHDGVERIQNYGFTSHPPAGAEAAVVSVLGHRDHMLIVALDHRGHRLSGLAEGEAAMFSMHGQTLVMKADGTVILTATGEVLIDAPAARIAGNLTVEGAVGVVGNLTALTGTTPVSLSTFRDTYNGHTHNENDAAPNPTGAPNQAI